MFYSINAGGAPDTRFKNQNALQRLVGAGNGILELCPMVHLAQTNALNEHHSQPFHSSDFGFALTFFAANIVQMAMERRQIRSRRVLITITAPIPS
jgi:hypothetical protein